MKINKKFSIENGLITILIFSLIVVFSLEIVQTKIQAKNLTIQPVESNKNKENTNVNDKKTNSNPVSTLSKPNEDVKEEPNSDSDTIQTDDTVNDETYIEDDSSNYWYPTDSNTSGGNNNYPEYTPEKTPVTPNPPIVPNSPIVPEAPVVPAPPVVPEAPIVPDPPIVPEAPVVPDPPVVVPENSVLPNIPTTEYNLSDNANIDF